MLPDFDADALIQRIRRLQPDSQPLWGKMTVGQMLAHCQVPLRVASGELKLKRSLIGVLFGGLAKKKLLAGRPFDRNLPTAPEFRVRDARSFETEKEKLVEIIEQFHARGADGITKEPHPFFGALSVSEWQTLQWKHLDHHLRQFGV